MSLFIPANSVDAIITDPPYEIGFMGKKWDNTGVAFDPDTWRAALDVLKPGGHLLAFGGARTYHRMACAIEDAGFEIRDQIMWVYGSGFPKGSNPKPAHEPIVVARKPFKGTERDNVALHGVGGLMIEACRVPTDENLNGGAYSGTLRQRDEYSSTDTAAGAVSLSRLNRGVGEFVQPTGRWPANLIHDGSDEVMSAFPEAPGQLAKASTSDTQRAGQNVYGVMARGSNGQEPRADAGSAARFFYCAKSSKSDRGEGNTHPTVKPQALMRYLCKLATPAGGLVLDPFMGSGSTGKAALAEGFRFIGIEKDEGHFAIAQARIA